MQATEDRNSNSNLSFSRFTSCSLLQLIVLNDIWHSLSPCWLLTYISILLLDQLNKYIGVFFFPFGKKGCFVTHSCETAVIISLNFPSGLFLVNISTVDNVIFFVKICRS